MVGAASYADTACHFKGFTSCEGKFLSSGLIVTRFEVNLLVSSKMK